MRVKIVQDAEVIGSIPRPQIAPDKQFQLLLDGADVSAFIKSTDWLYQVRCEDFLVKWYTTENGWLKEARLIADQKLGPGDFEAIRGFKWERGHD